MKALALARTSGPGDGGVARPGHPVSDARNGSCELIEIESLLVAPRRPANAHVNATPITDGTGNCDWPKEQTRAGLRGGSCQLKAI